MMKNFSSLILTITVFVTSLSTSLTSYAQEIREHTINWGNPTLSNSNGKTVYIPNFDGFSLSEGEVKFFAMEEIPPKSNYKLELIDFQTAAADDKEKKFIADNNLPVYAQPNFLGLATNGGGKRLGTLSISAFVMKNGQIHRITSFSTKTINLPYQQNYAAKSFATESVLKPGSGNWYKISVTQDGIYKIDKAFLTAMGVNVSSINPQHINIYGNGDGLLPTANNIPRTDDLAKNAIHIEGEADGVFNDNDYILFYAKGPHRWNVNNSNDGFENVRHTYSNASYYFININSNTPPERIQTINSSSATPTHFVTSYSYYAVHENDNVNLTKSGPRWYGEKFDVELSRTFSFPIPNPVINAPSFAKIHLACDSRNSSNGTINYNINGVNLLSTAVPNEIDGYYGVDVNKITFNNSNSSINVNIVLNRNIPSIVAYLDKIEVNSRRLLAMTGNQFAFRDLQSTGSGNISQYTVQNFPANGFVWDVTNRHLPRRINGQQNASNYEFTLPSPTLNEFVVSNGNTFLTPSFVSTVSPQNLHGLPQADYLIVTPSEFLSQANRLANLHRTYNGLTVHVVELNHIYNEFSGGAPDATAIRMFAKMFYDRSTSSADALKFLCLFGDGSYDPKNRVTGNNNYVPTFQYGGGGSTETPRYNLLTDDYYGLLDDTDAFNINSIVDIGIGRLLISSTQNAQEQVNKIEHYMKNGSGFFTDNNVNCIDGVSSTTFGEWRSKITSIADMEDYFIEINHEPGYNYLKANVPDINVNKLYMDAYNVTATVGGIRVPELNQDIINSFNSGSLITNYVGHGGSAQLSEARLVTIPMIEDLKNADRLPLFVSATCDFTPFDDPEFVSAGERMMLNPIGGAIAMMTTTRTVTYTANSSVISSFYQHALQRNSNNAPRTFGEIILQTKTTVGNFPYIDKTTFNLIGDPGLKLALPYYKIVIDSINGNSPNVMLDTLRALTRVTVKAHIEDLNGNVLTNFNGVATPSLYDKTKQMMTLGQNPGNSNYYANKIPFELQKNVIYRGQSTITNGRFSFEFIVPKDIDYNYGNGKFSLYGNSTSTDAIGNETRVIIGGINPQGLNDNIGPTVKIYLNNETFVNGGLTDENPFLIAVLSDENGINTVGNGIGHDITAIIDEKSNNPIILNEYFKNDLDTYKSGQLRYQLTKLTPGRHTLTLKAWDVNNNSTQETIEFIVQEKANLTLNHVLNYPNPFTTSTEFYFEHNQCCTDLETQIQIFTISGRLVKTINKSIYTQGYRSEGIHWDGLDDYGDELARGVYVYRLKVRTPNGEIAEKLEKLVLL